MSDVEQVRVVFRKWGDGDVIALFPDVMADRSGNCQSYMRVGQHGAANYQRVIGMTKLASTHDYEPLEAELKGIGYVLKVASRK